MNYVDGMVFFGQLKGISPLAIINCINKQENYYKKAYELETIVQVGELEELEVSVRSKKNKILLSKVVAPI